MILYKIKKVETVRDNTEWPLNGETLIHFANRSGINYTQLSAIRAGKVVVSEKKYRRIMELVNQQ